MQELNLFEYAVIRIMPRVEREEFLNTGVVLYCAKMKFLDVQFEINENRILSFCPKINLTELEEHLHAYKNISRAINSNSPISSLDMASRFRWLTATRSTIVQSSKVHPGYCKNPSEMLTKLFNELVEVGE